MASETAGTSVSPKEEVWESDWELTWPIWHMLPRNERKELANRYGYKTIGEFEEFMTLQRAVGDSTAPAYENEGLYRASTSALVVMDPSELAAIEAEEQAKEEEQLDDHDDESIPDAPLEHEKFDQDMFENAGTLVQTIPDELLLHKIFSWLPVDAYASLALVSETWRTFTRTEAVYKRLCERIYLNQSKRKALHVSRFGSYRRMLELRPRVKAGGGVYVMKYARVKKIQRDMWTEIPVGAVLEMIYYRYLYFLEDGRVLYALTASSPHEMFPRFRRILCHQTPDAATVWGTYKLQRNLVEVNAKQEWQHVRFNLHLDLQNLMHGRYGILRIDQHRTSFSGDYTDELTYEVPEEPFRFVRDKRL